MNHLLHLEGSKAVSQAPLFVSIYCSFIIQKGFLDIMHYLCNIYKTNTHTDTSLTFIFSVGCSSVYCLEEPSTPKITRLIPLSIKPCALEHPTAVVQVWCNGGPEGFQQKPYFIIHLFSQMLTKTSPVIAIPLWHKIQWVHFILK